MARPVLGGRAVEAGPIRAALGASRLAWTLPDRVWLLALALLLLALPVLLALLVALLARRLVRMNGPCPANRTCWLWL